MTRVQEQGGDSISAERLQKFLTHLESGQPEKDWGLIWQAKKESGLAKYRVQADLMLEQFNATIRSGQGALKSMFLVNGGAAVAVLALIGHLSTSPIGAARASSFALPLSCFAAGLAFTTMASGFTYLSQRAYSQRRTGRRRGEKLNNVVIFLTIAALLAFVGGCSLAYCSIHALAKITFAEAQTDCPQND